MTAVKLVGHCLSASEKVAESIQATGLDYLNRLLLLGEWLEHKLKQRSLLELPKVKRLALTMEIEIVLDSTIGSHH